jgi:perosamine synthetase
MNNINKVKHQKIIDFIRSIYGDGFIPLHRPIFEGNERKYLVECIDSNFVSSIGLKVVEFEKYVADFTGAKFAIATVNGTAALQVSLQLVGVRQNDEVITQALSFIATSNAIHYVGAHPVFVDVDLNTMGLSPDALRDFLKEYAEIRDGYAINKTTGRRISACIPMHTFGIPCKIEEIRKICDEWSIVLVEDMAESLGSYVGKSHTGTFGKIAALSFNGNKIITTGGGGIIITNDEELALRAKHIVTTAKVPHSYEFVHDEIGYNYRLPNLNAALGCAQMERLSDMLVIKADIAERYANFFASINVNFYYSPIGSVPNYWLNTIIFETAEERNEFLNFTNSQEVMTRPIWRLISKLTMYKHCQRDSLKNSFWLEERVVNIPSSVPNSNLKLIS